MANDSFSLDLAEVERLAEEFRLAQYEAMIPRFVGPPPSPDILDALWRIFARHEADFRRAGWNGGLPFALPSTPLRGNNAIGPWLDWERDRLAVALENMRTRGPTGLPKRKRAWRRGLRGKPLTKRQAEIAQVVIDCGGNYSEAARRLGISESAVRQQYKAAVAKIGQSATKTKAPKGQALPTGPRGEPTVTNGDDEG